MNERVNSLSEKYEYELYAEISETPISIEIILESNEIRLRLFSLSLFLILSAKKIVYSIILLRFLKWYLNNYVIKLNTYHNTHRKNSQRNDEYCLLLTVQVYSLYINSEFGSIQKFRAYLNLSFFLFGVKPWLVDAQQLLIVPFEQ